MTLLLFVAGLALLIAGAEILVRGASQLSLRAGIPPLVVGLTVVAFGTSAPELAVSIKGALTGQTDLAMGNVVGSNIFNILVVLGLPALVAPLVVDRQLVRQEVPILIGLCVLTMLFAWDQTVGFGEGLVLVGCLVAYSSLLYVQGRNAPVPPGPETEDVERARHARPWLDFVLIAVGLGMLVLGADWLVQAAVIFARHLGVSELVIGLTIVAAGTSLPEVATSAIAVMRGERDIAVGNVLGSCIFNLVAVLGIASLFAPDGIPVATSLLRFDLLVMCAAVLACVPILFTGHTIARWEGGLFFGYYLAYTAYLILSAQHHDALDEYSLVMGAVVIPLTAATLIAIAWREWHAKRRPDAN